MKCLYLINNRINFTTVLIFILFQVNHLKAQNYLDDYCILVEDIENGIKTENPGEKQAFYGESSQLEEGELSKIKTFLESDEEALIVLILKDNAKGFYEKLNNFGLDKYVYPPEKRDQLLGLKLNAGKRLFIFSTDNPHFLDINDCLRFFELEDNQLLPVDKDNKTTNDLIFIRIPGQSKMESNHLINEFISRTGKLPNFVVTDEKEKVAAILNQINEQNRFRAIVAEGDQKLENVSWNELPNLKSAGKIHVIQSRLSPHKRGYRFSPDVMNFNDLNSEVVKLFRASKFQLFDQLQYHFNFDENLTNKANPDQQLLYSYIEFEKDDIRGKFASFNGEGNYIDYGIPSALSLQEITISAWIKPTNLNGGRSIVGMGEVFSAKVFDGDLHFTTPDIMDHMNDSVVVKGDTWQHVAFIYMANKEVIFYYNGQLAGRLPASEITISPQSLLIGTNLWDEYFEGGLDDLLIWNRALSDEEIVAIHKNNITDSESELDTKLYLWILPVLFLLWGGLIYLYKKRKPISIKNTSQNSGRSFVKEHDFNFKSNHVSHLTNGIFLFGGFKLINKNGKELTALFSPKRRELFLLLLLHTFKNNGITSKKMSEILWAGHSFEGAKNNRSTQIKRLREILEEDTGIAITYDNKLWQISLEKEVYCDLETYRYFKGKFSAETSAEELRKNLHELLKIDQLGLLLPNMQQDWLDSFKSRLTEELLEILIPILSQNNLNLDKTTLLKLTNIIFALDPLNEPALEQKIRLLIEDGKHTLAKTTFEQYGHLYFQYYNEKFPGRFSEFV